MNGSLQINTQTQTKDTQTFPFPLPTPKAHSLGFKGGLTSFVLEPANQVVTPYQQTNNNDRHYNFLLRCHKQTLSNGAETAWTISNADRKGRQTVLGPKI